MTSSIRNCRRRIKKDPCTASNIMHALSDFRIKKLFTIKWNHLAIHNLCLCCYAKLVLDLIVLKIGLLSNRCNIQVRSTFSIQNHFPTGSKLVCLSVPTICAQVFLRSGHKLSDFFSWNLLHCCVFTQGRILLKINDIGSAFNHFPHKFLSWKRSFWFNITKMNK